MTSKVSEIESSSNRIDFSSVILAGGESKRMGYPKIWLKDGENDLIVEKLIQPFRNFGCSKIVLIINHAFCQSPWNSNLERIASLATIVKNHQPEKGRFVSLKLAAEQLISSNFVFIQNVDNPFVNLKLLEMLAANRSENGYSVPTFNGKGGHPILVSGKIINEINKLENINFNLRDILKHFKRKDVPVPWKNVLANINTIIICL